MNWTVGSGVVGITHPFNIFNYVGFTQRQIGTHTTINLPANAREGDLMIVSILGREAAAITDSRVRVIHQGAGAGGWPTALGVGYAGAKDFQLPADSETGVLPPLTFRPVDILNVPQNGGISQFSCSHVFLFRGEEIDGRLQSYIQYDPDGLRVGVPNGDIPSLADRTLSGSFVVVHSYAGIGGEQASGFDWPGRSVPYEAHASGSGTYSNTRIGKTEARRPPGAPTPAKPGIYPNHCFNIGIK